MFEELWKHYLELQGTRGWGPAGPLPITFTEIGNYNRECLIQLSVYEKLIIRRVDEAVLPVLGKRIKHKLSGKPDPIVVRANDTSTMRALFRGIGNVAKSILPGKKE